MNEWNEIAAGLVVGRVVETYQEAYAIIDREAPNLKETLQMRDNVAQAMIRFGKKNATPFDTFPEEEQDLLVEKMNKDLREPDRNIVVRFLRKLTAAELERILKS